MYLGKDKELFIIIIVVVVVMCFFPKKNIPKFGVIKNHISEYSCGVCPECLAKRANQWALRAVMQARESKDCCMITLTYDTFKRDEKGNILTDSNGIPLENLADRNVDKRDCQLFIKRLREYFDRKKNTQGIKYILTAEYGKRTHRPHYHAILFGLKFDDLIFHKKSKRGNSIYRSPTLEKLWKNGICTVDSVCVSSAIAKYCTKYCAKDYGVDDTFMLASQGVGLNEMLKAFNARSYWIDGQEYPVPRLVWQKYITKKYNFVNKSIKKCINHLTGEIAKISPSFCYVNKNNDLDNELDDIPFRSNVLARRYARAYRDKDIEYNGYLKYWRDKAEQRPQKSLREKVALLDNTRYWRYKSDCLKYMYKKALTRYQYLLLPRKKIRWEMPKTTPISRYFREKLPRPTRLIGATDRKKRGKYIVFENTGTVITDDIRNLPVFKLKYTQISIFD